MPPRLLNVAIENGESHNADGNLNCAVRTAHGFEKATTAAGKNKTAFDTEVVAKRAKKTLVLSNIKRSYRKILRELMGERSSSVKEGVETRVGR